MTEPHDLGRRAYEPPTILGRQQLTALLDVVGSSDPPGTVSAHFAPPGPPRPASG
jgi:hypothetical protein